MPTSFARFAPVNFLKFRAALALAAWALAGAASAAQPSPPFAADACGFLRGATGCTANDTNDISIVLDPAFAGSDPVSCNAGDDVTIHLKVTIGTTATERYNLGILFSKDGKNPMVDPATTGAQTCSAFTLPSPPFPELDTPANTCGDQSSASSNFFTTGSVTVKCVAGAGNKLSIPYVGLWNNQTAACSGVTDLVAGTSSKCTSNVQTVNVDVVTPRKLTLKKTWVNAKVNDAITVTTTGLTNNATITSTAETANETDTGSFVQNAAGALVTLPAETFNTGSQANYTTTVSCTGATPSSSTLPATFTMPEADVVCTYTNTRVARSLTLKKTWVNGKSGDAITATTTGLANNATVSSTSTGNNTDTGSSASNLPGATVTLPAETFNTGLQGNYTTTVACTGATPSGSSPGATFTMPDNDVTCTYTNTRVNRSLTLKKTWVNGKTGDAINATTTGLANNATVSSTSTGNNTDTGSSVSNVPGATVTLPAETFNTGLQGNYTTTVACTGATPSGSSPGATFTMPDADVTCTYTNTRVARNLTLKKTWVNGKTNDAITATTTGLANNATVSSTSTGSNTDTGSSVSNLPDATVTLPAEVFNTGSQSNYTTTVACTGATPSGSSPGATFTMPDNDVTCTYTNARNARTLTLKKTWVNGKSGDAITVTTTGLANNATVSSTSTGNNTDTGSAASNTPGATVTVPAETFNTGSQASYTTTVACTGATASSSTLPATFTMPDADVTCTYTNTRVTRSLTLKKTWVNGKSGDAITVTTTGLASNATISSTSSGNNTDTGSAVSNAPGATVTLPAEVFNTGSQGNYTTTVACTGATPSGSSPGATFTMPDNDVTCTYTNTRKQATLQLAKSWITALVGNTATLSASGFANGGTAGFLATADSPNETDVGAIVTVFAGESGAITEGAIGGPAAQWLSTLSCTGNQIGLAGNTLTVSGSDTAILCTWTNQRLPPAPGPNPPHLVPTMSEYAMALMAALLALMGAMALRQRRRR
jgi:hypothetical protein